MPLHGWPSSSSRRWSIMISSRSSSSSTVLERRPRDATEAKRHAGATCGCWWWGMSLHIQVTVWPRRQAARMHVPWCCCCKTFKSVELRARRQHPTRTLLAQG